MEQVIEQHLNQNPPLTLEAAKERLRALLAQSEENAWEIGDLLNSIENEGLARRKGYGKTRTWLEAALPETQGKTTMLYRYARVAAVYSKQQVQTWRVSKLELLMALDKEVLGSVNTDDPVNREVELLQPNGKTLVKKFYDCSYRDLQQSLRQRKKSPRSVSPSAASTKAQPSAGPQVEKHSLRAAFAMIGAGALLLTISEFLPQSVFTGWLALGGLVLSVAGVGIWLRHCKAFGEQLRAAFKEGKAIQFLKERVVRLGHGADKFVTTMRGNFRKAKPEPRSEETPIEKKAA